MFCAQGAFLVGLRQPYGILRSTTWQAITLPIVLTSGPKSNLKKIMQLHCLQVYFAVFPMTVSCTFLFILMLFIPYTSAHIAGIVEMQMDTLYFKSCY